MASRRTVQSILRRPVLRLHRCSNVAAKRHSYSLRRLTRRNYVIPKKAAKSYPTTKRRRRGNPVVTGLKLSTIPTRGLQSMFANRLVYMVSRFNLSTHIESQFYLGDIDGIHVCDNSDKSAERWLRSLAKLYGLTVLPTSSVLPLPVKFAPFLDIENAANPDAVACYDCIPLFAVEVVSENNTEKTFNKAVYDAIDILRICKAYDPSVSTSHAIVLPTLTKQYNAVLVTVRFEPFKFIFSYKVLSKTEVQPRVKSILKTVAKIGRKISVNDPFSCLVRLSTEEIRLFDENSYSAKQLFSATSIIVECGPWVFKYIPNPTQMFTTARHMFDFQLNLFPLTEQKKINNCSFKVFKKLQKPLTRQQAKPCLIPLLKGIKNAVEELHAADIAHLDLRLPNICFYKGKPILIDLDRCEEANNQSHLHTYLNSDMYTNSLPDWSHKNVDMHSVALIVIDILDEGIRSEDYHKMITKKKVKQEFIDNNFIKDLLNGEWNSESFATFEVQYGNLNAEIPISP